MFLQNYISYTQDERGIGRQNDVIQQIVAETALLSLRTGKKITARYRDRACMRAFMPSYGKPGDANFALILYLIVATC